MFVIYNALIPPLFPSLMSPTLEQKTKKTKFDEVVAIAMKKKFVNNFALSLIVWLWWSLASPGGDVIWVNKWQYYCCFTEPGCSSGVRSWPLYFTALIWTRVQGNKGHAHAHTASRTRSHAPRAGLQPCRQP